GRNAAKPVGEIDHAKPRVAGLVAQHEGDQIAQQRIGTVVLKTLEEADGDAFEKDLHTDDLLAVVIGFEQAMDQLLERRIEWRVEAELVEVAAEHLDVARLVDDLSRETE